MSRQELLSFSIATETEAGRNTAVCFLTKLAKLLTNSKLFAARQTHPRRCAEALAHLAAFHEVMRLTGAQSDLREPFGWSLFAHFAADKQREIRVH